MRLEERIDYTYSGSPKVLQNAQDIKIKITEAISVLMKRFLYFIPVKAVKDKIVFVAEPWIHNYPDDKILIQSSNFDVIKPLFGSNRVVANTTKEGGAASSYKKTSKRHVGKDGVSRVLYVKGSSYFVKRKVADGTFKFRKVA